MAPRKNSAAVENLKEKETDEEGQEFSKKEQGVRRAPPGIPRVLPAFVNAPGPKNENLAKRMISGLEAVVLKFMSTQLMTDNTRESLDVHEIAAGCETRDVEEILRALYTLEGKSLVEPNPPGDFTSSEWKITEIGKRAVPLID